MALRKVCLQLKENISKFSRWYNTSLNKSLYTKPISSKNTFLAYHKTLSANHHYSTRHFTRMSSGFWLKKRKNYDVVNLGDVSPKRGIPDHIKKPPYSESGVEEESGSEIVILDDASVKSMRQSCSLARIVLDEVFRHIHVGVSTDDLDIVAHSTCISFGAYPSPLNYRGFPKSICTSVNNIACHGIPDDRKLKDGDIISVDISVYLGGFHGDCAATFIVGNGDRKAQKLVETASLCLNEAIKICRHGQDFSAIGKTISEIANEDSFSVIPAFCGHGIGSCFHCPPNILHYENDKKGQMLKGMIFTIEPVICEGEPDIVILEDGWTAATEDNSRSAQFEHTILITESGAEVLTVPDVFHIRK